MLVKSGILNAFRAEHIQRVKNQHGIGYTSLETQHLELMEISLLRRKSTCNLAFYTKPNHSRIIQEPQNLLVV